MRWDEDVAREKKVCPMTLRIGEDSRFRSHNCIGSDCMAWRGPKPVTPGGFRLVIKGLQPQEDIGPMPEPEKQPEKEIEKKGDGFCGLAGPPE
jgi:hypothetical protein